MKIVAQPIITNQRSEKQYKVVHIIEKILFSKIIKGPSMISMTDQWKPNTLEKVPTNVLIWCYRGRENDLCIALCNDFILLLYYYYFPCKIQCTSAYTKLAKQIQFAWQGLMSASW